MLFLRRTGGCRSNMGVLVGRSRRGSSSSISGMINGNIGSVRGNGDKKYFTTAPPAPGNPFHLAIPVHSIPEARKFYGDILGLKEGRRAGDKWQDYSLHGHQLVCHYVGDNYRCNDYYNPVDGDEVPVPHFGVALQLDEFHELSARLKNASIKFIIEPHRRFEGQPGDQWTMFFKDPSGNNLEFKSMMKPENLFARYDINDV